MYKGASDSLQHQTRQAAEHAPTNGGIQASDAFKLGDETALQTELRIVQSEIAEINQRLAETSLRKIDRNHPDRRRLVVRQHELQREAARLKPQVKAERVRDANARSAAFQMTFMETARQMLATPVYERILSATLHKLGR